MQRNRIRSELCYWTFIHIWHGVNINGLCFLVHKGYKPGYNDWEGFCFKFYFYTQY